MLYCINCDNITENIFVLACCFEDLNKIASDNKQFVGILC